MHADFLILQICDFLDDGDGYYRLHEPSRQLSRLSGVVVVDGHFYHRFIPHLVALADVVVLPFVHNWDFFPLIEERRSRGQATVFEANDYFEDVQPWSPISTPWQDRPLQSEYRQYMATADAVQTSTAELARRWEPQSRRVVVFRNQLTQVPPLAPPPSRPLTIGWGGSPGHFADWYHVAPLLEKWLTAHPDVHLAVMTNEFAKPFLRLPPERYHFTPFGSLASYLKFLPSLDIGLAPLLPTDYNRGRSDVKYLEYASQGVPGIYADLEPYREAVHHGETGLIYHTQEELWNCLDALATDQNLRLRLREQAYRHVSEHRRVEQHIAERFAFYRSLLPGASRGADLPAEVIAASIRDGNYLQLRPQQPEQTFLTVLQAPASVASAQTLADLLRQFPNYQAALQHMGKLLNDLRDHQQALQYLEHAQALAPRSAAVLCEMGRARFCLKDTTGGRRLLEQALMVNPHYYPGWQYLLRLLALNQSADGPEWAEKACALFPTCYTLALAAASVHAPALAVSWLKRTLETYHASLSAEEKPKAAMAFGHALEQAVGQAGVTHEVRTLLHRAVEVFPESVRLANLLGQVLHLAGDEVGSHAQYAHALELRRAALLYREEFPQEEGSVHYWQFGEHIRRWTRRDV